MQDRFLKLMGPTRAAVLSNVSDSVRFEVVLKVKSGNNESEDKDLSFLALKYFLHPGFKGIICKSLCPR
jgi:hypothetical protein